MSGMFGINTLVNLNVFHPFPLGSPWGRAFLPVAFYLLGLHPMLA